MDEEAECLDNLHTGSIYTIDPAWREQVKGNLLWKACHESVVREDSARLDRWKAAVDRAENEIADAIPRGHINHVATARAFIACSHLALAAKKYDSRNDVGEAELLPLFHAGAEIVGYKCNCNLDHDELRFPSGELDAVFIVDTIFGVFARRPEFYPGYFPLSWAWDLTYSLLDKPDRVLRRRHVPVCGIRGGKGFLATLVIEVMQTGCRQVFHAPRDAFRTSVNEEFTESMKAAWRAACKLAQGSTSLGNCDGRWRLLSGWSLKAQEANEVAAEANDRSASGAAAWGWYFALTGKVPDVGIIVMAQMEDAGVLKEVEGVPAKAKAVYMQSGGCFDTIAVASEKNLGEVNAASAGQSSDFRVSVLKLETLEQLVSIRSQLANDLMAYYKDIEITIGNSLSFGGMETRSPVVIQPVVADSSGNEVAWRFERDRLGRAVILGETGIGKSFLSRLTAIEIARDAEIGIEKQRLRLDEYQLPIFAEIRQLVQEGGNLEDAIVTLVCRNHYVTLRLKIWIREKLRSTQCCMILDGLDRVLQRGDYRVRIADFLREMESHTWRGRIIITSNTVDYDRSLMPWIAEYRLMHFDQHKVSDFMNRWFGSQTQERNDLCRALDINFYLKELCHIPLIATIVCLAHKEITTQTRLTDVYNHILRILVSRAWQESPLSPNHRHVSDMLNMLKCIGGALFEKYPKEEYVFTNADIIDAIRNAPQPAYAYLTHAQAAESGHANPASLREELVKCGILVDKGLDHEGEHLFSFLHQTFFDFLVASHLAGNWNNELTLKPLLPFPHWRRIMPMIIGRLPNPTRMVRELMGIVDDSDPGINVSKLLELFTSCLAECKKETMGGEDFAAFWSAVTKLFDSVQLRVPMEKEWRKLAARSTLRSILSLSASYFDNGSKHAKWLIENMSKIGVQHSQEDEGIIHSLAKSMTLALSSPCPVVRWVAIWAIAALKRREYCNLVEERFRRDHDPAVRALAARALVELEHPKSMILLRNQIYNKKTAETDVTAAVMAMGRILTPGAMKVVMGCITDDRERVCSASVHTLHNFIELAKEAGQIDELARALLWCLQNRQEYRPIRSGAVTGLGKLISLAANELSAPKLVVEIRDTIAALLDDPNAAVCSSACFALSHISRRLISSNKTITALTRLLGNPEQDTRVRCSAARALGSLRPAQAIADLACGLKDESVSRACLDALIQNADLAERTNRELIRLSSENPQSFQALFASGEVSGALKRASYILKIKEPTPELLIATHRAIQALARKGMTDTEHQNFSAIAKTVPPLLKHSDANVRAVALDTLYTWARRRVSGYSLSEYAAGQVVKLLTDKEDAFIRVKALCTLRELIKRVPSGTKVLADCAARTLELLQNDNDAEVRMRATETLDTLIQLGENEGTITQAVKLLTQLLEDEGVSIQMSAFRLFETLAKKIIFDRSMIEKAKRRALDLLKSQDVRVLTTIIGTLGVLAERHILDQGAVNQAWRASKELIANGDPEARSSALITMEKLIASTGDPNSIALEGYINSTTAALFDRDARVKKSALITLEKCIWRLDNETLKHVIRRVLWLTEYSNNSVQAASVGLLAEIIRLKNRQLDPAVIQRIQGRAAALVLSSHGFLQESVRNLILSMGGAAVLDGRNGELGRNAEWIVEKLDHEAQKERLRAFATLESLGGRLSKEVTIQAVQKGLKRLEGRGDAAEQEFVLGAIGRVLGLGDMFLEQEALAQALAQKALELLDNNMKASALVTLQFLAGLLRGESKQAAVKRARALTEDKESSVRAKACELIALLGDKSDIAVVTKLKSDPDAKVRADAEATLKTLSLKNLRDRLRCMAAEMEDGRHTKLRLLAILRSLPPRFRRSHKTDTAEKVVISSNLQH